MQESNLKEKIKTELEDVYIDSAGGRHLDLLKALYSESQIQIAKDRKLLREKKIMKIVDLVMQVLRAENWGVFYKNQPIKPLELQDGNALYKVNQVDECDIEEAITKTLTKEKPWESSQTNLDQNNNSKNG